MRSRLGITVLLLISGLSAWAAVPRISGSYDNSLVLAPLHVEYTLKTAEEFASDVRELKQRIGTAPYVQLGFAGYLYIDYPDLPLNQPLVDADMAATLDNADLIVNRAESNGIITHISIVSGFFHGSNALRQRAIRDDVRNAQWFSDGLIAPPGHLTDTRNPPATAWTTPSRYAQPLRSRIEEGTRIVGRRLASLMAHHPETFLSISGDGETELTFERNFIDGSEKASATAASVIYTDYSPFMIEEFRDWIRRDRYDGDTSPGSDDDRDGHTFNGDFKQAFATWKLRFFDGSGPIAYADYVRMPEKLPTSGRYAIPGGFDAPRTEVPGDPYWNAWIQFRKEAIKNWVHDFAGWITSSKDADTGFQIPASRYYSHQIPADLLFGQTDNLRLKTSASYIETAVLEPHGGTGVTAFNAWDGKKHSRTATPQLYSALFMTSDNWGIMEYNPSMPDTNGIAPSTDQRYYLNELRLLYNFHPHVVIPFAWTDLPQNQRFSIKGTAFEKALHRFVLEIGKTPWFSRRAVLR